MVRQGCQLRMLFPGIQPGQWRGIRHDQCVSGVRSLKLTVECRRRSLFRPPAFGRMRGGTWRSRRALHGPRRSKSGRGGAADTLPNPSAIVYLALTIAAGRGSAASDGENLLILSGGSLGSRVDEERRERRYSMRHAESLSIRHSNAHCGSGTFVSRCHVCLRVALE